jgi:geranylgeranyl diphosphate synthase, type I
MRGATADGRLELPAPCVELARRVEAELTRFLGEQRDVLAAAGSGVRPLMAELERVIGSGGKRLRPLFCCLGHLAAGAEIGEEAIRAAAALELLHTFAIVHDDVMDGSPTRRGAPASWVQLAEEHRASGHPGNADSYGLSGAILAGDMALVLADRALLASGFPSERLLPAIRRYERMRVEVVSGQYLDVLAAHSGAADEAEARRIAVLKSGGYTVEGPLQIGVILGGGGDLLLSRLSGYGVPLGEAFQLRDDVLGVFGDPAVTGKDRHSDLREGKRTVLLAKALEGAAPEDRRFLDARIGRPDLTADELARARAVMESSGALDATLALIAELVARSKQALQDGDLPEEAASLLARMADVVAVRRV